MQIDATFFENKKTAYYVLFFSLLISLIFHFLIEKRAVVDIIAEADSRSPFKIYWKNAGNGWSEKRMAQVMFEKGSRAYRFWLTDLGEIVALRIDPAERIATVTIKSLVISQQGFSPIRLETAEEFGRLKALEGVQDLRVSEQGVTITPSNKDGQLLLELPKMTNSSTVLHEAVRVLAIFFIVFMLALATHRLYAEHEYALYLFTVVFVLVLVMATLSTYGQHPDEYVHVRAGGYYQTHYSPPPVGDESIKDTYSVYGVSRLHSGEIVYLLAGQFSRLLNPLHLPLYQTLRFFNVALLFILLLLAINNTDFRIVLLPLFLSSQIWYIFSYFNSEAFAVFVMLLASYQVVARQSAMHRLLEPDVSSRRVFFTVISLGLLLAFLLLSKVNFYFYGLFIGCYFLWKVVLRKTILTRMGFLRLLAVVVMGTAGFGSVRLIDNSMNDFKKNERLLAVREQYAQQLYKPSTPLEQKHMYLQMRDRGVSLAQIIHLDRWGEKSFRSAFGVFGYTSISASFPYYDYVRYTGILLFLVGVAAVVVRGGWEGVSLLFICAVSAGGLVAVALYHAWTVDFQAQGRYFLPIIGMLSVLFLHAKNQLLRPAFLFLLLCLYCLSVYSFLFVGLHGVSKHGLGLS